ncbi:MAG TPA: hypothetical protein VFV50_11825 [Bdellovibrionales bacterium]|nr:hypothetical protein [Bdellovibrionales bacterium]
MSLLKAFSAITLMIAFATPAGGDVAVPNNHVIKWAVGAQVHVHGIKSARIFKTTRMSGGASEAHIQMLVNIEGNICPAKEIALQRGVAAEDGTYPLSLVGLEGLSMFLVPKACIEISAPRTIQLRFAVSNMGLRESTQTFAFFGAALSSETKLYKGFRTIYDGRVWRLELF